MKTASNSPFKKDLIKLKNRFIMYFSKSGRKELKEARKHKMTISGYRTYKNNFLNDGSKSSSS